MHILVVEDEEKVASFIRKGLEQSSYTVDVVMNGEDALAFALASNYDALVLDIVLPGRDGLSVVRELRVRGRAVPILALTARNRLDDRVQGLDSGCDDYLAKPFAFDELLARLRALLRRRIETTKTPCLEYAGLVLDPISRVATRDGQSIKLSNTEYALLEIFLRHPNQVYTRAAIMQNVWGLDFNVGDNNLEVYMSILRKKVDRGASRKLLHTVHGVGYVLCAKP